jgi:CBS domain-containing protein
MTCADVMTSNPKYCEPGDSVARAAQIMRDEDVGPVPIVNNASEKGLVGIVTDRDLAIHVVAGGRDPNATRLEEIMSQRPVTCHPDQDAHDAMEAMSRHQIRRIPVVDDNGRLVGIIAQADLARQVDEQEIGEVLEDISRPGNNAISRVDKLSHPAQSWRGTSDMAGVLVAGGVGMALGATLMCLFDPSRGQARRERVTNAARGGYDRSVNLIGKAGRSLGRRTPQGAQTQTGQREQIRQWSS